MSRPHAEELKEQLCCDRGRAARPSELGGRGASGLEGEEEAGKGGRTGSGWRGLRGRRKGPGRKADARGVGELKGLASVEAVRGLARRGGVRPGKKLGQTVGM